MNVDIRTMKMIPDFYFGAPTLVDNCPSNLNVDTLDDQRSACGVGSIYRTIELF